MKKRLSCLYLLISTLCLTQVGLSADGDDSSANTGGQHSKKKSMIQEPDQLPPISMEDLLNLLLKQGVIDEKQFEQIIRQAKDIHRAEFEAAVEYVPEEKLEEKPVAKGGVVRVPYIPDYVRDQIRDKVKLELQEDVVAAVMKQAETERWGIPGTTPEWSQRISFKGDVRLRAEYLGFSDDNADAPQRQIDIGAVNNAGGILAAGEDAFLNVTEDRERLRIRARLAMKAKVTPGLIAGLRLVTGNASDPVSSNETLGDYGDNLSVSIDRAFIEYETPEEKWWFSGGRMKNPFLHTALVWDSDFHFDGVAARWNFLRGGNNLGVDELTFDPFVTLGLFPIQEEALSSRDKWLYAAQFGFDYFSYNQNRFSIGLALYFYENIHGRRNDLNSVEYDFTAPEFVQKGNSVFNIRNSSDPDDQLFALASDYDLVNLTLTYDMANFAPYHLILTFDYVENIGFDTGEVERRTNQADIDAFTQGYSLGMVFGWPIVRERGSWHLGLEYRYLESDAVVDAYTDSDFHLGGTDGKGFMLHGKYALTEDTWVQLKWVSTDEVDGQIVGDTEKVSLPLGTDLFQLDLNTRF